MSIQKRLGSALLAQDMISQFKSRGLDDGHWMKEAKRLFLTSPARIQFDAFSIASGEDYTHEVNGDGYVNLTPPQAGNLCGIWIFKNTDYLNIDFWSLIGITAIALPICIICQMEGEMVAKLLIWVVKLFTGCCAKSGSSTTPTSGTSNESSLLHTGVPNGRLNVETNNPISAMAFDDGASIESGGITDGSRNHDTSHALDSRGMEGQQNVDRTATTATTSEARTRPGYGTVGGSVSSIGTDNVLEGRHESDVQQNGEGQQERQLVQKSLRSQFLVIHWLLTLVFLVVFWPVAFVWGYKQGDRDIRRLKKQGSFWFGLFA
jgi:hypothetical protein